MRTGTKYRMNRTNTSKQIKHLSSEENKSKRIERKECIDLKDEVKITWVNMLNKSFSSNSIFNACTVGKKYLNEFNSLICFIPSPNKALRLLSRRDFEEQLVSYCQGLSTREWCETAHSITSRWCPTHYGMTLLHIAAALGYSRCAAFFNIWSIFFFFLYLIILSIFFSQFTHMYVPVCT